MMEAGSNDVLVVQSQCTKDALESKMAIQIFRLYEQVDKKSRSHHKSNSEGIGTWEPLTILRK